MLRELAFLSVPYLIFKYPIIVLLGLAKSYAPHLLALSAAVIVIINST